MLYLRASLCTKGSRQIDANLKVQRQQLVAVRRPDSRPAPSVEIVYGNRAALTRPGCLSSPKVTCRIFEENVFSGGVGLRDWMTWGVLSVLFPQHLSLLGGKCQ